MKKLAIIFSTIIMLMLFVVSASALNPMGVCGQDAYYKFNSETGELIISGTGAIGAEAFYGEDKIETVIIEDEITEIGDGAFAYADIISVNIGESVEKIGLSAFEGCVFLVDINFPESLKTISYNAFFGCDSIKSVALYRNLTSIGEYAFYECTGLESVNIPEGITKISTGTFGKCTSLSKIYIPDSVTAIGDGAFSDCPNLRDVYYCLTFYKWATIDWGANNDSLIDASGENFGHAHSYTKNIIVQPECFNKGEGIFTCVCGDIYKGEVAALGHNAVTIDPIKPTCLEPGKTHYEKCSRCNVILTEPSILPATGHKRVIDPAIEATCVSTGLTSGSHCDFCGEVFEKQNVIPMLYHNFDFTYIYADCTSSGSKTGVCINCDFMIFERIEAKGHNWCEEITEPTCETEGKIEIKCSNCKEVKEEKKLNIIEHNYQTNWQILNDPTCTDKGLAIKICKDCFNINKETLPATGHTDANLDNKCDSCDMQIDFNEGDTSDDIDELSIIEKLIAWFKDIINKLFGWFKF